MMSHHFDWQLLTLNAMTGAMWWLHYWSEAVMTYGEHLRTTLVIVATLLTISLHVLKLRAELKNGRKTRKRK